MKGAGQKVRYVPQSAGKTLFGRMSRDVGWDAQGVPEMFENKNVSV